MQCYQSYKPSGIQWVEKIPSHWGAERAKWLFNRMERPVRPEDNVVTAFRDGQVTLRTNRRTEGFTNAIQEHGYQGIRKGDLVIHAMDAFAGAIGVSDSDGKSTPVYAACVPRGEYPINSYYYAYLLRYMAHSGYIESLSKGIRERSTDFRFAEFRELPLLIPDKDEQDRIVAFLDQKNAEIDAAIAKKERLIELLQEQKKAAIRRAVTQGVKGSHQLISHDLSYLKQVPSDWSINRNKQLFIEKKDVVGKYAPSFTLLSLTLNGIIPRDLDNPKGKFPAEFDTYKKVQPNDIVFCLFDVEETPRTVGLARHVGMITGAYTVVECFDPSLAGYLSYFYTALDDEKMLRPFYTGLRNVIQRNTFFGLQVPIPPENERQEIVEYIDSVIHDTAQLAEKAKQEVISLQEFKNTLVASIVTGRIKV